MGRAVVVVGRKWNNPEIEISVTEEEIAIKMSLKDFLHALSIEMGNPTLLVTKNALRKSMQSSSDVVVKGMKQETNRVVR